MPTGWRSEYLENNVVSMAEGAEGAGQWAGVPRRYLERRSENLGANKLGHCEGQPRGIRGLNRCGGGGWEAVRGAGERPVCTVGAKMGDAAAV